ncbi:MAG TPA: hypothetical protein VF469_40285 [Kofleriaceae bacterium]
MSRVVSGRTQFTKIAVTVPTETYAVVERLRRRLGKSRSAVVALALEDWVRSADGAEADRRYVEGYLRTPEAMDEIDAVAAQATAHWDAWAPGPPATSPWETWSAGAPSRAAEPRAEPRAGRPRPSRTSRTGTPKRPRR